MCGLDNSVYRKCIMALSIILVSIIHLSSPEPKSILALKQACNFSFDQLISSLFIPSFTIQKRKILFFGEHTVVCLLKWSTAASQKLHNISIQKRFKNQPLHPWWFFLYVRCIPGQKHLTSLFCYYYLLCQATWRQVCQQTISNCAVFAQHRLLVLGSDLWPLELALVDLCGGSSD